jgi:HlyD family secretion protein
MTAIAAPPLPMPLHRRLTGHFIGATAVLVLGVIGFGVWASTVPISSAAIASGTVIPAGDRMVVQHLEGGIVREILVREGDVVEAGASLILLDTTQVETRLKGAETLSLRYEAARHRLDAHMQHLDELVFPDDLVAAGEADTEFGSFLATQQSLFANEKAELAGRISILDAQVAQLRAEIAGREQEVVSADSALRLLRKEMDRIRPLVEQNLAQRSQLTELERNEVDIETRRAQSMSLIAQAEQRVAQLELTILNIPVEFLRGVSDQLANVSLQLSDLNEKITSERDILERTVVVAPVAGTVVDLKPNTPGAVIGAGQPLLDIVPAGAALVVNARLSPIDVDTVQIGLDVQINVLSFHTRNVPPLKGKVTNVSADSLVDEATGAQYYAVEIAIDRSSITEDAGSLLVAGMPAEVYILTGSRTFLQYVAEPILASFRRSFRDS